MSLVLAIVIPVFNPGSELADALSSICADPNSSVVILVDDGSVPAVQVGALSSGINLKLIRLDRNRGVAGALNAGVNEALRMGAKYIARFDGDDLCVPDRFIRQLEIMESREELSLLGSRVFYISGDGGRTIGESPKLTPRSARRMLYIDNPIPHPTWLVRADVFRRYGLYAEDIDLVEDYQFLRRVLETEVFDIVADPLVYYRVHDRSVSRRRRCRQLLNLLMVQLKTFRFFNVWAYAGVIRTSAYVVACPVALFAAMAIKLIRQRRDGEAEGHAA